MTLIDLGDLCMAISSDENLKCINYTGTPVYQSPETFYSYVAETKPTAKELFANDIWCLGVTFYEFLKHGELPMYIEADMSDNYMKQLEQWIKSNDYSNWKSLQYRNRKIEAVINMMLKPRIEDRASSIDELLTILDSN